MDKEETLSIDFPSLLKPYKSEGLVSRDKLKKWTISRAKILEWLFCLEFNFTENTFKKKKKNPSGLTEVVRYEHRSN